MNNFLYKEIFIRNRILLTHTLRIMKIQLILLFIFCTGVYATETYSQEVRISISHRNSTVKNVLDEIEKKTNYFFLYNEQDVDVNRRVSVSVSESSLKDVLSQLFNNTEIAYVIEKNNIVLVKRNMVEQPQQTLQKVTGVVTDEKGEPIIGATIKEKGGSNGVVTDLEGNFSISVSPKTILQISYIGYTTREITVGNKKLLNIQLKEDSQMLDEVVVVGYGTINRRDLTGSVASVNGAAMKDIPVTSAAQAIVGRMPGVQVTQTDGSPDAEIKIRVRGGGSLTQDNSPLYIVDGFPVDNINDIAPTDISSIDILKDASSTAIYGARGANGVVIVTTKSGVEGKPKINYNMHYGVKNITKTLDVLDPYEYVWWQYEIMGANTDNMSRYFGDYRDFELYKEIDGTNWQDEIFGRTGTSFYNNLSVSGGTKAAKYNISLTRNDEKEIMLGSGLERTNFTTKTSYELNKWIKLDLNTRLSHTILKGAGTGQSGLGETSSRLPHIIQFRPVNGLSDFIDGGQIDESDFEVANTYVINPLDQTLDDYRKNTQLLININAGVDFQIMKDLKYRLEFGVQSTDVTNNRFYGLNTSNARNYGEQPVAEIKDEKINSYRLANTVTYSRKGIFPGSNLVLMVGQELNSRSYESKLASAKYFPKYVDAHTAFNMMDLGKPDPIVTVGNPDNKTASFFGRLNYDYKGRYLFSAVFRADGSSKFAPGNQWGYFPSAAIAWRVSDEAFMASTSNWLSNLKFRLSYGQSGNNRIADDVWKKTFSVSNGAIFMEGNEETMTNYIVPESTLSNPRLKWETTITRNIGLDFGLFNQRLSGTVEIYKNTTKDLLIRTSIPSSTGYSTQYQNVGQTSNKGIELTLEGILVDTKDFTLSASFNIAFNKNRIDKLGDVKQWEESSKWASADGPTGDFLIKEGGEIGMMYGYQTAGMYTFDEFDYDPVKGIYTLKEGVSDNKGLVNARWFGPGTLKFVNQDDDLTVNAKDKVVIGNANPKHTGGFNLSARYKGLDFSAFFNWVYGNDIYNANKLNFTNYQSGRYYKNVLSIMNSNDRFSYIDKATGTVVTEPEQLKEMNKNAKIWSGAFTTSQLHSWAVEDGSFLRLNNVTIGYSFPRELLKKISIGELRIYATGYNLFTWTKYSGYDPEVDSRRSTPLTPGVDWCAYPRSRSFNFGLNVTF